MKKNLWLPFTLGLVFILFSCKKDQSSGPQYGSVTDIDGNVYKTVKIGDQEWMAENLKVTHYNSGITPQDEIPLVLVKQQWADLGSIGTGLCAYYNGNEGNTAIYGLLYNAYAVKSGKLAPKGWHVATKADWQKLQDYLIANGFNYDGTKTDNKIAKAMAAKIGWNLDSDKGVVGNDQANNNNSGFNAFPGGLRQTTGEFIGVGESSYWWTSTTEASNAIVFYLTNASPELGMNEFNDSATAGLSVRCVKD